MAASLAACTPTETVTTTTSASTNTVGQGATVTWIYDGDTIEVEGNDGALDVRLVGINAPDQGECFHQRATDHLIDTLKGRQVRLEVVGSDQFDRQLAVVWHGERQVNLELIGLGLAIAVTPEDPNDRLLIDAEETAYQTGAGLWADDACGTGVIPLIEFDGSGLVVDPPGPDHETLDGEVVVLVNRGAVAVDLTGWVLRDESSRHRYRFTPGSVIGPGAEVTIRSSDPGWDPGDSAVWNNGGDVVLLLDDGGRVIARFRY
jgi:endonuclease YncB( thermonuclease family)